MEEDQEAHHQEHPPPHRRHRPSKMPLVAPFLQEEDLVGDHHRLPVIIVTETEIITTIEEDRDMKTVDLVEIPIMIIAVAMIDEARPITIDAVQLDLVISSFDPLKRNRTG